MTVAPKTFGSVTLTESEFAALSPADQRVARALAAEMGGVVAFPVKKAVPDLVLNGQQFAIGKAEVGGQTVALDVAKLLDGRLLIQAASGSGKSWTLRRILEQTAGMIQQVVIDPEGEFRSLAEVHGHLVVEAVKLDIAALAIAAARVRRHRLSVLLDLSDLDRSGQMQAVGAFVGALIDAPATDWHPCLVVIDEAHLFAPFGDQSAAAPSVRKASIAKISDLMSRGRKRGLCGVLATQRLARLSKSVSSEALNHLVGLNTLDLDIRRAAEMIGWDARRAFDRLPVLAPGEFVAVGPAFSQSPCGLKVGEVLTRHLGARPDLSAPDAAVDAASLLGMDELVAASEADAEVLDEARLPLGMKAVRGFIRDAAFADAGRCWHALRPLAPEGAVVAHLADHLGMSPAECGAALALLDRYGAIQFLGHGAARAVRITKEMIS